MGFSVKQVKALRRGPDHRHIGTREANGRELTYLEGWYAITGANRIFGFDGWSRETIESRCVLAREKGGSFLAVYIARVRLTVQADGATVIREGHGTGEGRGTSPGEVHDIALKAAETDATKRALATFGRPFGLELYRGGMATAQHKPLPAPSSIGANETRLVPGHQDQAAKVTSKEGPAAAARTGLHPDDTTPIPRPSHYYGRRHQNPIARHFRDERQKAGQTIGSSARTPLSPAPPLAPGAQPDLVPGRIDKSVLTIGEPKRLRDKAHLGFVASQPCLVCGRQPTDPHHLRFAQPRAIGLKVSDEFTVPLCRGHHRQLREAGNEMTWGKTSKSNRWKSPRGFGSRLTQNPHPQIRSNSMTMRSKTRPKIDGAPGLRPILKMSASMLAIHQLANRNVRARVFDETKPIVPSDPQ